MTRITFDKGKQKEFLDVIIQNTSSPSLRSLLQFGITTNYSELKNIYSERRSIPKDLFEELCTLAKINKTTLNYQEKRDSWGQVIGGKKSKRRKNLKASK